MVELWNPEFPMYISGQYFISEGFTFESFMDFQKTLISSFVQNLLISKFHGELSEKFDQNANVRNPKS